MITFFMVDSRACAVKKVNPKTSMRTFLISFLHISLLGIVNSYNHEMSWELGRGVVTIETTKAAALIKQFGVQADYLGTSGISMRYLI